MRIPYAGHRSTTYASVIRTLPLLVQRSIVGALDPAYAHHPIEPDTGGSAESLGVGQL